MITNLNQIEIDLSVTTGFKVVGFTEMEDFSSIDQISTGKITKHVCGNTGIYHEYHSVANINVYLQKIETQEIVKVELEVRLNYTESAVQYTIKKVNGMHVFEETSDILFGFADINTVKSSNMYLPIKTVVEAIGDNEYLFDEYFIDFMNPEKPEHNLGVSIIQTELCDNFEIIF